MSGTTSQTADEDDLLDEALDQSFPASDPPSMTQPKKKIKEPPLDSDSPSVEDPETDLEKEKDRRFG